MKAVSSNLHELRSEAAKLLRLPDHIALFSPDNAIRYRSHNLRCKLLRITGTTFAEMVAEDIRSEALSETLRESTIQDRILSAVELPELPLTFLPQTDRVGCPVRPSVATAAQSASGDGAGGAAPEPETASFPGEAGESEVTS